MIFNLFGSVITVVKLVNPEHKLDDKIVAFKAFNVCKFLYFCNVVSSDILIFIN